MRGSTERINAHAKKIKAQLDYDAKRLAVAAEICAAIVAKRPAIISSEVGDAAFDEELKRTALGAIGQADVLLRELGYEKP